MKSDSVYPIERPGKVPQAPLRLTELESLRDARGYELTVTTAKGVTFQCRYRPENIPSMYEAIKNNMREHATRYFTLSVNPLHENDWPSKPMTMEQWIAAGHTLD